MKKAESMPLNIIITAVILLIVLIVILAFFTGRISLAGKDIDSCASKGGKCEPSANELCPEGEARIMGKCDTGQACCLKVFE